MLSVGVRTPIEVNVDGNQCEGGAILLNNCPGEIFFSYRDSEDEVKDESFYLLMKIGVGVMHLCNVLAWRNESAAWLGLADTEVSKLCEWNCL